MANKKVIFSVSAGAFIAGSIYMAEDVEAASYKVERGDSLWKIAQKYDTSVSKLMSLNNLSGNIIHPDQVIETSKDSDKSKNGSSGKVKGDKTSNSSSKKATTYTVKSGDTLSGIASEIGVSLKQLMDWNDLDSTLIFPGNTFTVKKGGSSDNKGSASGSSSSSDSNSSSNNNSSSSSSVYTVKSGDTLSGIASKHKGVSVQNIKKWNSLKSDLIVIGQKLKLSKKASDSSGSSDSSSSSGPNSDAAPSDIDYNVDTLMNSANTALGTPYEWAGSTLGGFDCSGFIHYAYNKAGKDVARLSSDGYYSRSYYVDKPKVGDLVFFEGTYRPGISHLGIYVGNNEFIHAGSDGVEQTNLNNPYWKKHFDSFKRFY